MTRSATYRPAESLEPEQAALRFREGGALFAAEVLDSGELADPKGHLKRCAEHVVPRLPEKIHAKSGRVGEKGALRYWPGSHVSGLLPHVPAQSGQGADPTRIDHDDPRLTVMGTPPGSAAIHSGLVVHDSPPNTSGKPRLGPLCGYRGAHTRCLHDGTAN